MNIHQTDGSRGVTEDGRLIWIGPILPHHTPEFFLDGKNLGNITLDKAMELYKTKIQSCKDNSTFYRYPYI